MQMNKDILFVCVCVCLCVCVHALSHMGRCTPSCVHGSQWSILGECLSVSAVISLALGLYQTFGGDHKEGEPKVEWVEGVAIIVAIV